MATAKKPAKKAAPAPNVQVETNGILLSFLALIRKSVDPNFAGQGKDEAHNEYLRRIVKAANSPKITDAEFETLSGAAQEWYDAAARAYKVPEAIPLPEDVALGDGDGDAALEEGTTEEGSTDEPGNEAASEGDAERAPKKRGKGTAKPKKEKGPRKNLLGFSVIDMRREVIKNPAVTVAQLTEIAKKAFPEAEIKVSTITIARATTLTVVKLMKELGRWKD
jgi:hypothetical protein